MNAKQTHSKKVSSFEFNKGWEINIVILAITIMVHPRYIKILNVQKKWI